MGEFDTLQRYAIEPADLVVFVRRGLPRGTRPSSSGEHDDFRVVGHDSLEMTHIRWIHLDTEFPACLTACSSHQRLCLFDSAAANHTTTRTSTFRNSSVYHLGQSTQTTWDTSQDPPATTAPPTYGRATLPASEECRPRLSASRWAELLRIEVSSNGDSACRSVRLFQVLSVTGHVNRSPD